MKSTKDIRTRLVAIVDGDATLQSLLGRTSSLIKTWEDVGDSQVPVIAYQLLPFTQTGENGNSWEGWIRFAIIAQGDGAVILCEDIKERLIEILTWTALYNAGTGVDAAVMDWNNLGDITGEDRKETRALYQHDLEVKLRVFYQ